MPLTRYLVRNEYGLADPEVYRGADRDDPEAILEGVAMAGLVGVLRQLGDLAQFAAEIFHDLHEEVMATAERGHGLMARVQQLEAEIPSIEKAFLSQTDHSSFFSSAGVDWHPNLHMEQSLITRGDLPRFVMNSYEECRGPPRLFLLDKFDVAGAGACLKRYTDPSFFKVEAASSEMAAVGIQREKKARKVKKKGSRWRNGDTPEVVPTSHAKLHQLFLEERVENGHPDPARLVKLKRRQLNRSACDLKAGKSYMEKFLETPSPDHKVVHEVSATLPLLKLTSDNSSESGLEILDIRVVSPVKRSSPGEERTLTLPNTQEVIVKPFMDELNGEVANGRIMKASVPSVDDEMDESPIFRKIETEQELAVNVEDKTEGSLDGDHSDDMASDVDNFMDALTTMESEMETDNEYKYKNNQGFLNVEKGGMDSDASVEQPDIESNFSDSQSIGISSASDDGNNSFKKERFSSSHSDSLGNIAENIPSDSERAAKVPYVENSKDGVVNSSSDHPSICADRLGSKLHELVVRNYTCSEEDKISDPGEVSRELYLAGSNPMLQPSVPEANSMNSFVRPELEETPFDSTKIGSRLPDIDKKGENLYDSSLIMSGVPLQTSNDTSFTVSSESRPVDESDHEISDVSSDGFVHTSNTLELNHGTEGSDDSVIATENCVDNLVEVDKGASVSSILDSSEFDSVSEVDAVTGMELNFDNSMVDTSETCSIKEQQCSDIIADISQVEVDSAEVGVSYSEEKRTTEVTAGYAGKVDSAKVDGAPCEHLSDDLHKLGLKDHVSTDDVAVEAIAPGDDTNDDINNILSIPLDLTSCSSRNLEDMEKSVCGFEDTQQRVLDLHEANSPKCLSESKVQKDVEQLEVAPTNLGSVLDALVSDGRCNQEATKQFYNPPLAEQAQINSYVSDGTTAPSSERNHELESKPTYRSHSADTGEDDLRPPTCLPEAGASLRESVAQADQIDVQTVHPSIDEVPNSSNLHTSPTCSVAEPQIPLGQMSELHNDILDRNSSHADEAHSTISSNFQSEHMESVCHADYESYTDTSASFPGDLSGQELLLQPTGREFCRTMLAWNPFDSSNPTFSSMPETTQVNLEAMPPLPPLPPIQWRIGKIQPNPLAAQRESIDHTQGSFPLTQPFASDNKAQFPLSDREIVQSSNPFLSFDLADRQRSQHSSADSVGSSLQSTPLLLEIPAIGTNANGQQEGVPIEGTQSLNPFFTSAEIHNKKTEHGSLGLGGESIQSNSNSSSQAPRTEHTTSGRDPLPSHSHSGKQLATETGVEVKVPEHSSQNSAREQGNSPDKLVISQTLGGEQQHDLVTSSEEIAWSPDTTLALLPTYEAGKLNGKKLPRPRNPLIDAVAAHDKSKLRKVTERVRPRIGPMAEERDSLLEQIRSKSFNLKPTPSTRPSIQGVQGPKTNLKVAAILQKATAIRQALTGSDEDDDSDSWSDS